MKKLLLDTHALIWWLNGDERLGQQAREQIGNSQNEVYVSAASVWEMAIKKQLGKLDAPDDIEQSVELAGFSKLDISMFHAQEAGSLPNHHKDPFDRMLIAQAQISGSTIVTQDAFFSKYSVRLIDAGQ